MEVLVGFHPVQGGKPEAISLLGKSLFPIELPPSTRAKLDSEWAKARSDYVRDPENADNIIWLGRRTAYLWRYRESIDIFTDGIKKFPNDARMYRHRGHRYITVRDFEKAINDLEKAAQLIEGRKDEVEPDGQPNRLNIPTSTLHFNIWYHLGLAHYLRGNFDQALDAYLACLEFSWTNDDRLVAAADWLCMTFRRLGRESDAQNILALIHKEMSVIENVAYHRRLLMYKGEVLPDSLLKTEGASDLDTATQGYGVGNWYLVQGKVDQARKIFERVVEGPYWAAFGYIAAEAELERMKKNR